jgi:hypothetical protein
MNKICGKTNCFLNLNFINSCSCNYFKTMELNCFIISLLKLLKNKTLNFSFFFSLPSEVIYPQPNNTFTNLPISLN